MSVTRASIIKGFHDASRQYGDMRIASDFSLQIDGWEDTWLYIRKQFWPELSPGEGIEVPTPLGSAMWQPSQSKFNQQSSVTFSESATGIISQMFQEMMACGSNTLLAAPSRFNAWVYHGTPENWLERARIEYAFIQLEPIDDPDWESRSQLLTLPGTIFYHFYGQYEKGSGALC